MTGVNATNQCGCPNPMDDTSVTRGCGKTVLDAGNGDDNINVHTNFDGSVDVCVNGKTYSFSAQEAQNLEIRGGNGNDNITMSGQ
ncbi:MAG: hypothetical protein JAZ15_07475, partial [Candidatus Thiodiazotropha endolucinida]|nr:hypothetical protein [Candidatus Thiodiazotropha taylori]MCW4312845.1 hypothetical protein [Candidatus Thiodiazotropha taylori]